MNEYTTATAAPSVAVNTPPTIPPIIININAKLGSASINILIASLKVIVYLDEYLYFFANINATTITDNPHNMPGIYPAINRAATDVPPRTNDYIISELLGGISNPVGADAILTAAL